MGSFDNAFHDVGVNWSVGILCEIWNSQNLEIRFGLRITHLIVSIPDNYLR